MIEPAYHGGEVERFRRQGDANSLEGVGNPVRDLRRGRRHLGGGRKQLDRFKGLLVAGGYQDAVGRPFPSRLGEQRPGPIGVMFMDLHVGLMVGRDRREIGVHGFAVPGKDVPHNLPRWDGHGRRLSKGAIVPGFLAEVEGHEEKVESPGDGKGDLRAGAQAVHVRGAGDIAEDIQFALLEGQHLGVGIPVDHHVEVFDMGTLDGGDVKGGATGHALQDKAQEKDKWEKPSRDHARHPPKRSWLS